MFVIGESKTSLRVIINFCKNGQAVDCFGLQNPNYFWSACFFFETMPLYCGQPNLMEKIQILLILNLECLLAILLVINDRINIDNLCKYLEHSGWYWCCSMSNDGCTRFNGKKCVSLERNESARKSYSRANFQIKAQVARYIQSWADFSDDYGFKNMALCIDRKFASSLVNTSYNTIVLISHETIQTIDKSHKHKMCCII